MALKIGILLLLVLSSSAAQTLTVCQVLQHLSELNGKEVKIRGLWAIGDAQRVLLAIPQCLQPTIRDGWVWRDGLEVYAAGGSGSFAAFANRYAKFRREHPGAKILATLTGRLETRDRFEIQKLPNGIERPIGFGYFAAGLSYFSVDDLEAVPFGPREQEQRLEIGRQPYATRAK